MKFKLQNLETSINISRIANVHYFEFTPLYHTTDDAHNFCELLFVDRGSINVQSDNFSGILTSDQMLIHRPNEKHSLSCTDDISPNVIVIGFECDSQEIDVFSKSPVTLQQKHKKMLSEIMKEGMSVYAPPYDIPNTFEMNKRTDSPFASEQMLKISLEAFLITLVREYNSVAKESLSTLAEIRLGEIVSYINEHYCEKIALDSLCFLFNTNKTSLCQSFKSEYGVTVLNYINQLKIKEAKYLLRNSQLSVTEISEKLGFNGIHYFCRLFKKRTGLSPNEYKNSIKSRLEL